MQVDKLWKTLYMQLDSVQYKQALEEACSITDWIRSKTQIVFEVETSINDDLDELWFVLSGLGHEKIKDIVIDNIDEPEAAQAMVWWNNMRTSMQDQSEEFKEPTARESAIAVIEDAMNTMPTDDIDFLADIVKTRQARGGDD